MTTTRVPLDTLIDTLRPVATGRRGPIAALVAGRLRAALADPRSRDGLIAAARSGGAGPAVVHAEPGLSLQTVVWTPGEITPVHDHVAWCVVANLTGTLLEHRYRYRDGRLVLAGTELYRAGRVEGFAPPGDIHAVVDPGPEPAVSLHVYGADLGDGRTSVRRFYDLPVAA